MRGDIFMARKQYREAIETYGQGSVRDAVLRNKMGIAYHKMLDLDRARKCYEEALKIKPDYFEAMVYYSLLFRQQAPLETDPVKQQALVAEANRIRDEAVAIVKKKKAEATAAAGNKS